jgi:hypothetical protein
MKLEQPEYPIKFSPVPVQFYTEEYICIEIWVAEADRVRIIEEFIKSESMTNKPQERFASGVHFLHKDPDVWEPRLFCIPFEMVSYIL